MVVQCPFCEEGGIAITSGLFASLIGDLNVGTVNGKWVEDVVSDVPGPVIPTTSTESSTITRTTVPDSSVPGPAHPISTPLSRPSTSSRQTSISSSSEQQSRSATTQVMKPSTTSHTSSSIPDAISNPAGSTTPAGFAVCRIVELTSPCLAVASAYTAAI